jgi:hypothetical protein
MTDLGPRLTLLTQPAQLDKQRFVLEWALPLEPGLETHVTLYDRAGAALHTVAASQGPDEADTLLALWTILTDDHAHATEAIEYVAETYATRTGRPPARER